MKKYKTQVKREHYNFGHYLNQDRWLSYFHQISCVDYIEAILKKKLSILEIGIGDKIVNSILKKSHKVLSMDIDNNLKPDILSALPKIPFSKKDSFDCVICCEVLEHIKFSDAEMSIKKMSRIARYLIISIPHKSFYFSISIRIPMIKTIKCNITIPTNFIRHNFNGEHYWELGTYNYETRKFKNLLKQSQLEILKEFRIPEYPYHHFFILESQVYIN